MFSNVQKNILSTIIYYDILDYPLTFFEIWKYLISNEYEVESIGQNTKRTVSLLEIVNALESEEIKKYIEACQGFYFLKGREKLVRQRIERNKISEKKFKIIRKVVFWLKFCPFVRMVAVTGTVAMKNAERRSDLDFFVVLKKSRIFTGRLLVTFLVHILGRRRYGAKITDRVCLNYYVTKKDLKIRTEDLFSSLEYSFIFPVFGGGVFKKFQKENEWIENFRPNLSRDKAMNLKIIEDSTLASLARKSGEWLLGWDFLEKFLGDWQRKRIANDPRTKKAGSFIVADKEALIFLPEPQGPKIYSEFKKRLDLLTSV